MESIHSRFDPIILWHFFNRTSKIVKEILIDRQSKIDKVFMFLLGNCK